MDKHDKKDLLRAIKSGNPERLRQQLEQVKQGEGNAIFSQAICFGGCGYRSYEECPKCSKATLHREVSLSTPDGKVISMHELQFIINPDLKPFPFSTNAKPGVFMRFIGVDSVYKHLKDY